MFARIKFALIYWLCWVVLFELARVVFIGFHWTEAAQTGWSLMFASLWYGLRMDISMASYLLVPVCLILIAGLFMRPSIQTIVLKIYTGIILAPVLLIILSDIPAYNAWGYRLDATPLKYLQSPKEAWASVSHLPVFWIVIFYLGLIWGCYQLFSRQIQKTASFPGDQKSIFVYIIPLVLFTGMQIIPIRGGFQLAPMNQSGVYFTNKQFANLSAINATWNFMHSLSHHLNDQQNPFVWMDEITARNEVNALYKTTINHKLALDSNLSKKPNVILIVWESLTQKAINQQHNDIEITPGLNQLIKEGIYFSDVYATGDRTDKGIVGVLSGYPAQPTTSIIKIPQKADKLPKLPKQFLDYGYQTSFFYGGELEFANMKSYLLGCGFNQLTEKSDFDRKDQNSKWGAHDGVVKNKLLQSLPTNKEPYFTTWLTLSSHEPYETPVAPSIQGNDDVSQFLNSLHYTDSIVFELIRDLKQLPSWKNTLVVIVADHGHRLPRSNQKINDFKIPMLWLGGAIQKGMTISTTASQIDLPATLLSQVGIPYSSFNWSKNIFSQYSKPWAYYCFNNGFGFVSNDNSFVFDNVGKQIIEQKGKVDEPMIESGKAMEQLSFQDYLKK